MRFGWKERRILQRRLKNRIPEAVPINLPRLALCVTAAIIIEPRALAMISRGDTNPFLAPVMDKNWAKQELSQTMPSNPVKGLESRLAEEVAIILKRMATNQMGEQERLAHARLITVQPSKRDYLLNLDGFKDAPATRQTDGQALHSFMAQQGQKAGSDYLKENVEVLRKLQSGLNFDLNLTELFSTEKSQKTQKGSLRYGLILKGITPDSDNSSGATVSTEEEEFFYAGHADVEWTIGPINEDQNRSLTANLQPPPNSRRSSLLNWLKLPRGNFSGRVRPEIGTLNGVQAQALPNWSVEFAQDEGFYRMIYKLNTTGKKISEEHQFRIPLDSGLSFGRRYNDKWQAIETNAHNILIDKNLPIISVHQMHIEERYRIEASKQFGRHRIAFQHKGKPGNPEAVKEAERPESYSIKYETIF